MIRFRPRFTVRRLMVAVAVIALAMSAAAWHGRMRSLSVMYEMRLLPYAKSSGGPQLYHTPIPRPSTGHERWEAEIIEKYSRAARYPWLPVEPDKPEPK